MMNVVMVTLVVLRVVELLVVIQEEMHVVLAVEILHGLEMAGVMTV